MRGLKAWLTGLLASAAYSAGWLAGAALRAIHEASAACLARGLRAAERRRSRCSAGGRAAGALAPHPA